MAPKSTAAIQKNFDDFKYSRETHLYYYTVLGLLLSSTTFVLTATDFHCRIRIVFAFTVLLTLFGIFGVSIAGIINYLENKDIHETKCVKGCHIFFHFLITSISLTSIVGICLVMAYDLKCFEP